MEDPKWVVNTLRQESAHKKKELGSKAVGKKRKTISSVEMLRVELEQGKKENTQRKSDSSSFKEDNLRFLEIRDKSLEQKFLESIGFISSQEKWACKNCLFGFVVDYLAVPGGDEAFFDGMEKCQFEVINIWQWRKIKQKAENGICLLN